MTTSQHYIPRLETTTQHIASVDVGSITYVGKGESLPRALSDLLDNVCSQLAVERSRNNNNGPSALNLSQYNSIKALLASKNLYGKNHAGIFEGYTNWGLEHLMREIDNLVKEYA